MCTLRRLTDEEIEGLTETLPKKERPAVQTFLEEMPQDESAVCTKLARLRDDFYRGRKIGPRQRGVIWAAIKRAGTPVDTSWLPVYMVLEGQVVRKMSRALQRCVDYVESFMPEERATLTIVKQGKHGKVSSVTLQGQRS